MTQDELITKRLEGKTAVITGIELFVDGGIAQI
jgi:hypothetical protein